MTSPSRRNTLTWLLTGSLAAVATPVLYIVARYLTPRRGEPARAVVGMASEVGGVRARIVKVGMKDAIVMIREDGSLHALSLRCTHAGCNVNWHAEGKRFHCPCHGGEFDANGKVVAGPPRRPLEELVVQIDNGRVIVVDETVARGA